MPASILDMYLSWMSRANRAAKPISSDASFGCSKFFLMVDTEERRFKCGMHVERGYMKAPPDSRRWRLESDWDWHRLLKVLKPKGPIEKELKRLVVREGFGLYGGSWEERAYFTRSSFPSISKLRLVLLEAPRDRWAGFQVFYQMGEREVRHSTGVDLVESMLAVFAEVTPVMNLCTQTQSSVRT